MTKISVGEFVQHTSKYLKPQILTLTRYGKPYLQIEILKMPAQPDFAGKFTLKKEALEKAGTPPKPVEPPGPAKVSHPIPLVSDEIVPKCKNPGCMCKGRYGGYCSIHIPKAEGK